MRTITSSHLPKMPEYVATFYTHLAAMRTYNALREKAERASMEPTPRELSASCGSCVRYVAADELAPLMHRDYQAIYTITDSGYERVIGNDEAL